MQEIMMNVTEKQDSSENSESENDSEDEVVFSNLPTIPKFSEKVFKDSVYVLHLAATSDSAPRVATALSDGSVEILDLNNEFESVTTLDHNKDKTVELKFECDILLWTATKNGTVNLWDLRDPKAPASVYTDTTDENEIKDRQFNTFDISKNSRLLCAGTDCFEGDSFLLFWDLRSSKLAGAYWESHTDDITQVRFHPTDNNKMLSGSTDGLINMYDLSKESENDALVDTLNTESSIEKINWSQCRSKKIISCITHTADVQLWKEGGVRPFGDFKRGYFAEKLSKQSENYIYISDVHVGSSNCSILAGSGNKCARLFELEKDTLKPTFRLAENHQRIRCSFFNENLNLLLTGGEKGCLNAWKLPVLL